MAMIFLRCLCAHDQHITFLLSWSSIALYRAALELAQDGAANCGRPPPYLLAHCRSLCLAAMRVGSRTQRREASLFCGFPSRRDRHDGFEIRRRRVVAQTLEEVVTIGCERDGGARFSGKQGCATRGAGCGNFLSRMVRQVHRNRLLLCFWTTTVHDQLKVVNACHAQLASMRRRLCIEVGVVVRQRTAGSQQAAQHQSRNGKDFFMISLFQSGCPAHVGTGRWVKSEGFGLFFTNLGGQQAQQRLFTPTPEHQRGQKGVEQGRADQATKNDHGDGMQYFLARSIG